jgi:tripartite-type tricarboxylate transporter receptor subunit TctC
LAAPAKTPSGIVQVLDAATAKISASAAFQAGLAKVGLEPLSLNATAAAPFIERELAKWAKVAKAANIQLKP